jgi:hypothetical protein
MTQPFASGGGNCSQELFNQWQVTPPISLPPSAPEYDTEVNIFCAPNGDKVRVVHVFDESIATGTPVSTTMFNVTTGIAYSGSIATLSACGDIDTESDGEDWCAGGIDFTKFYVKTNGQPTGVVYWVNNTTNVTTTAAPSGATKGKCAMPIAVREMIRGFVRITDSPYGDGSNERPSGWSFSAMANGGVNLKSFSYVHIPNGDYGSSVNYTADNTLVVYSQKHHENIASGESVSDDSDSSLNPKIIFNTKGRAVFEINYSYWA